MECVIGLFKTECIRTTVFHAGPYRLRALGLVGLEHRPGLLVSGVSAA
jgi:hypothetical protein